MENKKQRIKSWSCFSVISCGFYDDKGRFISNETDIFNPDDITNMLHTKPKYVRRYGEPRIESKKTNSIYKSSAWYSYEITDPPVDRNDQCYNILKWLTPYEKELIDFKKNHNVFYEIEICIYEAGNDILIDSEIISFCNRIGIELRINTLLAHSANSTMMKQ
jgi:hypothetical protein